MRYMIDYPTPFDTVDIWEKFLSAMLKMDQSSNDVRLAIIKARQTIAEKTADHGAL